MSSSSESKRKSSHRKSKVKAPLVSDSADAARILVVVSHAQEELGRNFWLPMPAPVRKVRDMFAKAIGVAADSILLCESEQGADATICRDDALLTEANVSVPGSQIVMLSAKKAFLVIITSHQSDTFGRNCRLLASSPIAEVARDWLESLGQASARAELHLADGPALEPQVTLDEVGESFPHSGIIQLTGWIAAGDDKSVKYKTHEENASEKDSEHRRSFELPLAAISTNELSSHQTRKRHCPDFQVAPMTACHFYLIDYSGTPRRAGRCFRCSMELCLPVRGAMLVANLAKKLHVPQRQLVLARRTGVAPGGVSVLEVASETAAEVLNNSLEFESPDGCLLPPVSVDNIRMAEIGAQELVWLSTARDNIIFIMAGAP